MLFPYSDPILSSLSPRVHGGRPWLVVLYKSTSAFRDESSFVVGLDLLVILVSALPAVLPIGSAAETSLKWSALQMKQMTGRRGRRRRKDG